MGLSEYILYGGIPQVVLCDGASEKTAVLKNLFSEIYLRDIIKRNRIKNSGNWRIFLNFLASSIGSLTNPEKLRIHSSQSRSRKSHPKPSRNIWIILKILT
jgi:predicted AAA+ superfamily ATPase